MSNYVVHFTHGGEQENDYENIISICYNMVLRPKRAFGIGTKFAPDKLSQQAVCFSEIPPGAWHRLSERRKTSYGIGFTKKFIQSQGGGQIWYVDKGSPHRAAIQRMMKNSINDPKADVWKLTPMIDAPGTYSSGPYYFEWEREWRHVGPLEFKPRDVAFLLIPEKLHGIARTFFEDAEHGNYGPAYLCPYVDPKWPRQRILAALKS